MKFDASLLVSDLETLPGLTRAAESMGFDGLWVSETAHDGFLPLALAAEHSRRLSLGNSVAVAFARSPTVLAYLAWDLAKLAHGRFILGLGSQVKGHVERRFGVKWEKPVQKMRETVLALRAFWDCWQRGTRLNVRGEFFNLDLMSPFFNPGPHDHPDVPITIAGVNRAMIQLAGELCQGLHVHPFHTAQYLREFVLPHLKTGLRRGGQDREGFSLISSSFVVPTDDPRAAAAYEAQVRQQVSFYASTPAYRVVFELHGWAGVAERLSRLAAKGQWAELPSLISDEILDAYALSGTWTELPRLVRQKYGGLLDRVSYYFPFVPGQNDAGWQATLSGFQAGR